MPAVNASTEAALAAEETNSSQNRNLRAEKRNWKICLAI
jgi:hypothetical protein